MIRFVFTPLRKITNECLLIDCPPPPCDYSSRDFFFFRAQKHGGSSGCRGAGRNGQLPALCGCLEERVHIARHLQKGNRYGSMALPSVTAASRIHGDKRGAAAAGETTAKAPVCYCSPGPRVLQCTVPLLLKPRKAGGPLFLADAHVRPVSDGQILEGHCLSVGIYIESWCFLQWRHLADLPKAANLLLTACVQTLCASLLLTAALLWLSLCFGKWQNERNQESTSAVLHDLKFIL